MFNPDIIYKKFDLNPSQVLIPKYGDRYESTVSQTIEALYLYDKEACGYLGISSAPGLRKYLKILFPGLNLRGLNNRSWESWLLAETGQKKCTKCSEIMDSETNFSKDKHTADGYKSECKTCVHVRTSTDDFKAAQAERNRVRYLQDLDRNREIRRNHYYENKDMYKVNCANRRAAKLNATPKWADMDKIKEIYLNCPEGYEVDHIYPLQSDLVCGLHIPINLQYLTMSENRSKGNKMPEERK